MPSRRETFAENESPVSELDPSNLGADYGDIQQRNPPNNSDLLGAVSDDLTYEKIAERAYQLWHLNGCRSGFHEADWIQAEQELGAKGSPETQQKAKSASASDL